jgi:hypothetical protein
MQIKLWLVEFIALFMIINSINAAGAEKIQDYTYADILRKVFDQEPEYLNNGGRSIKGSLPNSK